MLVSTFESLFRSGTRYFKGFAAENLWKDTGEYVVITVNFSALSYSDNLERQLDRELYREFALVAYKYGITVPSPSTPDRLISDYEAPALFRRIVENSTRKVVLLIDEYDYPLCHSLANEAVFLKYRDYLANFYGVVKAVSDRLRFVFITGISRFSHVTLFSQLNNLLDLSLKKNCATLLGYTDSELHEYFDAYVAKAAEELNLSKENMYREIKKHYDGFLMHPDAAETVYNPWSVLNFLISPEEGFCNYWYESGGLYPSLIVSFIRDIRERPLTSLFNMTVDLSSLKESYEFFTIPPRSLLFQTGYLTIRTRTNECGGTYCYLTPPNLEVKSALLFMYFSRIRSEPVPDGQIYGLKTALVNNLATRNTEKLIMCFNLILNTFGYDNLVAFDDERNCRDFIYVALLLSGIQAYREDMNALGRADLSVDAGVTRYVIEFKLARKSGEEDHLLQEAVTQIMDRRYGEVLPGNSQLLRLAVVISAVEKSIVRWQLQE